MSKQTTITFKLESDLKKTFQITCQNQGFTHSLVLRELMKRYIKENAQTDIFKNAKK